MPLPTPILGAVTGAVTLAAAIAFAIPGRFALAAPAPASSAADATAALHAAIGDVLDDSLLGRSGKLRVRFVPADAADEIARAIDLARDFAKRGADVPKATDLEVLPLLPFSAKVGGKVGPYFLGTWPHERRWRSFADMEERIPAGFIQVTPDNRTLAISEHFRLGDFLTKNQFDVWPKALVLREPLVDKLELVIAELKASGVHVAHMQVMSGFRTPAYNALGVGRGGRAKDSRHQYGDAADVFVDNDRDGRMDDLNGDGRVNIRDADVIVRAAERVEQRIPALVGGIGRYKGTSAHGPFVHIDVRGKRARWG